MALTNWGGTDADIFAPFFGGGFPSGALTTQRGGGNTLRGIPLDVVEVRSAQALLCICCSALSCSHDAAAGSRRPCSLHASLPHRTILAFSEQREVRC